MALKAILTPEEHGALAEPLKTAYVAASDGKSFVLDADVDNHPSVRGLKNTVEATRSERETFKTQLQELKQQYGDLDPVKAKEALAKIQKLEEKNLIDEGKIEELFNQRTDRMRKDHDNQNKKKDEIIAELQANIAKRDALIADIKIDGGVETAALKIGVRPAALPDVKARARMVWRVGDDGNPTPYRGDQIIFGKDGKGPMTMDEWCVTLQQDAPHLFEGNTGGRTEPSITRVSGGGKAVTLTREQARDPQQWRIARDRATKEGAELVVQD